MTSTVALALAATAPRELRSEPRVGALSQFTVLSVQLAPVV